MEKDSNRRLISRMNRWYDNKMSCGINKKYYKNSGFFNFGYWDESSSDQKSASENLTERLLSFIPEKSGKILDVACGNGGTAAYLLRYYPPSKVTGINISEKQLETARKMAPGCTFLRMDAAQLEFECDFFDNIICLEAVFHFSTREDFLSEAYRVLKPGGRFINLETSPFR